jgi:hypothetical protein
VACIPPTDARRRRRPGRATRLRPGVASRPWRWARRRAAVQPSAPKRGATGAWHPGPRRMGARLAAEEVGKATPDSSVVGSLRR